MIKGLNAILSGGTEFITFEEGKPLTLLFIDWYEDLMAIREHYEPSLNPKYIRCPGKDVCPLCKANPGKYPSLKIKFRVYDPTDKKVKFVSLAKTHIQKLNTEFNLEEVDPTRQYVTIYRTGKGASDTSYSARAYRPDPAKHKPEYEIPNFEELDMPDILPQVTAHTPEEIQGFMDALLANPVKNQYQQQDSYNQDVYNSSAGAAQIEHQQNDYQQGYQQYQHNSQQYPQGGIPQGRKLPF